jgi:hypothetical protein
MTPTRCAASSAAREPAGQRLAAQQLHREVRATVVDAAVEHRDDPGVLDACGRLALLHEALANLGVGDVVGEQNLDRDLALELGVTRRKDHAKRALAKLLAKGVLADRRARRHGLCPEIVESQRHRGVRKPRKRRISRRV